MCEAHAIEDILAAHPRQPQSLVQVLQDVQKKLHYLPKPAMLSVAQHLGVPQSKVYAVATFYKTFSLVPRGEHLVRVCMGTACHVRGAGLVVDELKKQLKVSPGETTVDKKHTLEVVNCVGACALAPVVMVDEDVHGAVAAADAHKILPGVQQ